MNCINCGAHLTQKDQEYCPNCGFNVTIQRKVEYLSGYYYNQGLEKATIRDLSGAINCLKQSLCYNKNNIQARNLLGLVYFETGEVVAALSEWVISKNLKPKNNLASEYISKLQANTSKLEAINDTIRKYNHSLELCRQGHEDMAAIELRRLLSQNSKLIKGYHLLALIQIRNRDWNKARRILRKAARIDKTNTTTLRFLKEVDEQTGYQTRLETEEKKGLRVLFRKENEDILEKEPTTRSGGSAVKIRIPLFLTLLVGLGAGAVAYSLLVVPSIRQGIYRQANQQIVKYSESLASQGTELSRAQGEVEESGNAALRAARQYQVAQRTIDSYHRLLSAYNSYAQGDLDTAALEIQKVYESAIADDCMAIYNLISSQTGVSGIKGREALEALDQTEVPQEDTAGNTSSTEKENALEDSPGDSGYTAEEGGYEETDPASSGDSSWSEEYDSGDTEYSGSNESGESNESNESDEYDSYEEEEY